MPARRASPPSSPARVAAEGGARTTDRRALDGRLAEEVVADYLFARGFAVLGQNVRLGHLEIDLVAQRGPLVVIVEVRTRRPGALTGPLASVTSEKRRNLLRATERLYRRHLRHRSEVERLRIDVAGVHFGPQGASVNYVEGAVVAGLNARL